MVDVTQDQPALLHLQGVHKRFPGVHALRGVDLRVLRGEVHAIIGENGAGKTTLVHVLAGVHAADEGTFEFDGCRRAGWDHERQARDHGISIVYQERSLFPHLSVAENIFSGRQPVTRWGVIDRREMAIQARHWLDAVALRIQPDTLVEQLSPAQQQQVEIAKALSLNAKLLILDEPTACLSTLEVDRLFTCVTGLCQRGVAVLYISHRMEEVFRIADRATVLKDGQWQGTFDIRGVTPHQLVSHMVGRSWSSLGRQRPSLSAEAGPAPVTVRSPLLEIRGLRDTGPRPLLQGIDLEVTRGEIVAIAGLVGAGRTEVALSLFGCRHPIAGEFLIDGKPYRPTIPANAMKRGIAYLAEDRKDSGLFTELSVADNIGAAAGRRFGDWLFSPRALRTASQQMIDRLKISCRSPAEPIVQLSGGNQQKAVLARWLLNQPQLLIVDEPTRGVDVSAKDEMHQILGELASRGVGVIVISSDLPEVLSLADRIYVMRQGILVGQLNGRDATEEAVVRLASLGSRALSNMSHDG